MITIDMYAIRDDGDRGHHLVAERSIAVPRVGETVRVPGHAISYWLVQHVAWARFGAHPEVELWLSPV